jgi:hypothetical protein
MADAVDTVPKPKIRRAMSAKDRAARRKARILARAKSSNVYSIVSGATPIPSGNNDTATATTTSLSSSAVQNVSVSGVAPVLSPVMLRTQSAPQTLSSPLVSSVVSLEQKTEQKSLPENVPRTEPGPHKPKTLSSEHKADSESESGLCATDDGPAQASTSTEKKVDTREQHNSADTHTAQVSETSDPAPSTTTSDSTSDSGPATKLGLISVQLRILKLTRWQNYAQITLAICLGVLVSMPGLHDSAPAAVPTWAVVVTSFCAVEYLFARLLQPWREQASQELRKAKQLHGTLNDDVVQQEATMQGLVDSLDPALDGIAPQQARQFGAMDVVHIFDKFLRVMSFVRHIAFISCWFLFTHALCMVLLDVSSQSAAADIQVQ